MSLSPGERVGFREECESCGSDLHVCLNCAHHDPGAHNQCREPGAEHVADRERANHCEWFRPGEGGGDRVAAERDRSRTALDALFKKSS